MQLLVATTGIDRDYGKMFSLMEELYPVILLLHEEVQQATKFSASLRALHDEGVVITDDYKLYTGKLKVRY